MFKRLLGFFRASPPAPRAFRSLAQERSGHFFSWFNLQPDGEPTPLGGDRRLSFHPSGPAFHALVRLDVTTRDGEQIVGSELWVARSFIEGRQSAFARDIVASFLRWALTDQEAEAGKALIANIGNMRAANEPVLMRADGPPSPPVDQSGGYGAFLGERELATLALGSAHLTMRNVTNGDRSRWLTLKITA
jgi:hypothetical protein